MSLWRPRRPHALPVAAAIVLSLSSAPGALAQSALVNGRTVTLVSATPTGAAGNGQSYGGAAHAAGGGACLVFGSLASDLAAGDANAVADVFVREGAVTTLESRASDGAQGDGPGDIWNGMAASARCRVVAFGSRATNLVPGDVDGRQNVFVRDRDAATTTRVAVPAGDPGALRDAGSPSLSEDGRWLAFDTAVDPLLGAGQVYLFDRDGQQVAAIGGPYARRPAVSGDGRFVAFATYTRGSVPGLVYDDRLWLHDRDANGTRELARLGDPSDDIDLAGRPAISRDGRLVAFASSRQLLPADANRAYDVYLQDTLTGERVLLSVGPDGTAAGALGPVMSPDGRFVAFTSTSPILRPAGASTALLVVDRVAGNGPQLVLWTTSEWLVANAFTPDGLRLAVTTTANWAATDTRADSADVYLVSLDSDDDGVPDAWETRFGMNPYAADASGDADGDGRTNLEEFLAGTHPRGLFTRMLAEGATGLFATTLGLANPDDGAATAVVSHLPASAPGAQVVRYGADLGPGASRLLEVGRLPGLAAAEFSTLVESDRPLAVERLMTWDARSYGGHTETGLGTAGTSWFFAEGATHSHFDLFYLLQNGGDAVADVDVRYLLPAPASPFSKRYQVPPHSRRTIWVNHEDLRLASTDVSAHIVATQPIVAERAMYLSRPGLAYAAGHASAGALAPSTTWAIAEGATGPFFDLFVLLANPGEEAADVRLRYLLPDGATVEREHVVPPGSRATVWVDYDAPALTDTAVSTVVTSGNGVPVVAERAMWWPGPPAQWLEAHAASASPGAARRWLLPPSAVLTQGAHSFLLLANPASAETAVEVVFRFEDGTTQRLARALPAQSRTNVWVNVEVPATRLAPASVLVTADGPIVVERADYWQAEGVPWEGGTATRATPVPLTSDDEAGFRLEAGATLRASFDDLMPGTYPVPLQLDEVRIDLTAAREAAVRPPLADGSRLATSFLAAGVADFGNNVVIALPEGTTAAGLWIESAGPLVVTATDTEGGGAVAHVGATGLPAFVGFHGGPGLRAIRVSSPSGAVSPIVNVGDIVYAKP